MVVFVVLRLVILDLIVMYLLFTVYQAPVPSTLEPS